MASAIHPGSQAYPPPPTFSRTTTESSTNGIQHSHSTMNSFDAPRSSATTPTPTPPASRHQNHAPYMSSFNGVNSNHVSAPRPFQEPKLSAPQKYYASAQKSEIYTAVYSGVSVYEMELDGLAVMRRRTDSWMNATQILKLAGIDKGKRTKVLEKEILSGEHEKVQGGYGKYQGTWISYQRAVEFARCYGVLEPLRPLLEYDMGQDGLSQAGAGNMNTPTKEQAMAAQRKRNMLNGGSDRVPAQSSNGTFFKNISKSAANAVNAISKARFDSPAPRPPSGARSLNRSVRRSSQQMMTNSQDSAFAGSSQQSMQSLHPENGFGSSQLDPSLRGADGPFYNESAMNEDEPPRKRVRASFSQDTHTYDGNRHDATMRDASPSDGLLAYQQGPSQSDGDYRIVGLPPLKQPSGNVALEKQRILSSLFMDSTQTNFVDHPALQSLSGEDLDIPIDATCHTALHWAATLARTSLLRALIRRGANVYRLNTGGESALIRAAVTTNNLDQGSFPELLELLGPTMEIRDGRGRTVLHHIAVASAVKGPKRSQACRYYLDCLLEYVVRSGSASNSQVNSFQDGGGTNGPLSAPRPMGLAHFMSEVVDTTDMSGDTALNLATRVGNNKIIHQLLEVGANPAIPNRNGLRPIDFGVAGDLAGTDGDINGFKAPEPSVNRVTETSQELVQTINSLISTTQSSFTAQMQSKQSLIDTHHAKLRETTALLTAERARLADLQARADERTRLRSRIANLRSANDAQRAYHISSSSSSSSDPTKAAAISADMALNIRVGEADAGLEIDTTILPPDLLESISSPTSTSAAPLVLTAEQKTYLTHSLPPTPLLLARLSAYRRVNEGLEQERRGLQDRSFELEKTLRRVVSLCTGVREQEVDEMVGGLSRAVESEGVDEVEVGRVREFLRRVGEGGGDEGRGEVVEG